MIDAAILLAERNLLRASALCNSRQSPLNENPAASSSMSGKVDRVSRGVERLPVAKSPKQTSGSFISRVLHLRFPCKARQGPTGNFGPPTPVPVLIAKSKEEIHEGIQKIVDDYCVELKKDLEYLQRLHKDGIDKPEDKPPRAARLLQQGPGEPDKTMSERAQQALKQTIDATFAYLYSRTKDEFAPLMQKSDRNSWLTEIGNVANDYGVGCTLKEGIYTPNGAGAYPFMTEISNALFRAELAQHLSPEHIKACGQKIVNILEPFAGKSGFKSLQQFQSEIADITDRYVPSAAPIPPQPEYPAPSPPSQALASRRATA